MSQEVSLSGTDLKGAAKIVNGDIELLQIELMTKDGLQDLELTNTEQIRSLSKELNLLLTLVDQDIPEVDYESADDIV